ncbi:hypothetical protein F2Q69_00028773 [Brassica cretica]|uniref:Uncharacterized protein n=1 Tax=Brassica cretica TaxID=69181 RepID=A0A8S9RUQ0_BRACR|nr:hypothetical protein F2Q69_00028773 [Brassica cretica]
MKRLLQIPASRFLPPGSGFLPQGYGFLPPGLDPASSFRLPGRGSKASITRAHRLDSRQGNIPHLEDLLLRHAYDGMIPVITINKMKLHAHCSTSTTLLLGSGHDLQLISRVPPCSLKHIDTSGSLQHINRSTICSGHVPSRTDDSYPLQSYVLLRLRAC